MGLQVKLTISRRKDLDAETKENQQQSTFAAIDSAPTPATAATTATTNTPDNDTSTGTDDDEGDLKVFAMQVESTGKFSRKANWTDLNRFTGKDVTSDVLRDMIVQYQKSCFPDDAAKPNSTPKWCYIKDENGSTLYKDFGWKPIKLNLQTGMVDVKERWTKEVCLETFPLDYSTNLENILLQQGDKKVTSTLRKTKLAGHALAKEMMKTNSEIVTEFKGIDSTTFVLGNQGEPTETDPGTGDEIWRDVKSLRALLHGATLPKKSGAGTKREAHVLANESYLKARVYYRAFFVNDVATDHIEKFDGKQYWKFPIKYLFQYNDIPNAAIVYEDIELRFFTDVRVAMDNKDFEWVKDENGRWKKQYAVKTTSVSRIAKPVSTRNVSGAGNVTKASADEVNVKITVPVSKKVAKVPTLAEDPMKADKNDKPVVEEEVKTEPTKDSDDKEDEPEAIFVKGAKKVEPIKTDLDKTADTVLTDVEARDLNEADDNDGREEEEAESEIGNPAELEQNEDSAEPEQSVELLEDKTTPQAVVESKSKEPAADALKSPKPDPDGVHLNDVVVDAVPFEEESNQ